MKHKMATEQMHLLTLLVSLTTGAEAGCYFSTYNVYMHACFLSDGAIAGIVIGSIVGVGVLIAICVGCCLSNRRHARLCQPTLSYNAHYYHHGYGYPAGPVAQVVPGQAYPPQPTYPPYPPPYGGPPQPQHSAKRAQKY